MNFEERLPKLNAILPVFAVLAFMIYGWTIVVFLWKFPSWLLFLTAGDILILFAYSMTSAFLESLLLLGVLLLVCALLPARWLRDVFVTRGTFAVIASLGFLMAGNAFFTADIYPWISYLPFWLLGCLIFTVFFAYLSTRIRGLDRFAAWISDNMTIFLFLLIPLSFISFCVVLYRNIF